MEQLDWPAELLSFFVSVPLQRMASETFNIRLYFALLIASIVSFTVLVIVTVQNDIAKSTVSREGLSVQLAVNDVCSIMYAVTQGSIWSATDPSYDMSVLNALR